MPRLDPEAVAAYRPRAQDLVTRISNRINSEVTSFAEARDPRVREAVNTAIEKAVTVFVDTLAGAPTKGHEVFALYRWIGEAQALAGHGLDAMRGAHHIATQESWDDLRAAANDLNQTAETTSNLADALMIYQDLLFEQAENGFDETRRGGMHPSDEARGRLLVALLTGTTPEETERAAAHAGWTPPAAIAVAVARRSAGRLTPADPRTMPDCLTGVRHHHLVAVVGEEDAERAAEHMAHGAGTLVAVSWPVPLPDVHHAYRWAQRALSLTIQGIAVAESKIVRCRDVESLLALHADPALRRHLDEHLLAPLLVEQPGRRATLAETMLLWLRTGHSAPRLAEQLDVHHQTVRHRIRRLRELFGEQLADPKETAGLLNALESMTPQWRQDSTSGTRFR